MSRKLQLGWPALCSQPGGIQLLQQGIEPAQQLAAIGQPCRHVEPRILPITALAAARAMASPPKVPEKKMSSMRRMYWRRPTTAEMGKPLAMPLPKAARSGVTPNRVWAPPRWKRKPVMVSSKMSRAPCSSHSWRRPGRKSGAARRRSWVPGSRRQTRRDGLQLGRGGQIVVVEAMGELAHALGHPRWRVVEPMYQSCQPW